jgi:isopentenyl-diphosphate delta-isomerase type 1
VKADTPTLIRKVAEAHRRNPKKFDVIFKAIGKLVFQARAAVEASEWKVLGELLDENHLLLTRLGVSTSIIERLVKAAIDAGAWGAKLSGAGGGDCIIALAPASKRSSVEKAITDAGGEVVRVATGAPGVSVETTDDQTELFIVVDKNDNVLGYRSRAACHSDRSFIHRSVGVVISDRRGRILLQRRSLTKDLQPGLWGVSAAGHVAKGETYDTAVERELSEELGVKLPLAFFGKTLFRDKNESEVQAIYTARIDGPLRPDAREIAEVRYFEKSELARKVTSGEVVLTTWAQKVLGLIGFLP